MASRFAPEPLIPEPLSPAPISIFGNPESIRPSFDALRQRFLRNFTDVAVPKAERLEGLNLEVVLSPDEAARGVVLRVGVPVFRRCATCAGTGHEWFFPCLSCGQEGVVEDEEVVSIRIPPMVASGTMVEVALEALGIRNLRLQVHVSVGH